jgi:Zn-dependent metalloprotease
VKFLRQGICLLVLGGGLAAVPGLTATASPTASDGKSLVQKMKDEADGSVTFSKEKSTGKVGFVRVSKGGDLLEDQDAKATDKARAYLDKYAAAFGARPGELRESGVTKDKLGSTVTYTQSYKGVPVFGSMLRAHVDKQGDLTSVNGFASPDLSLSVTPRLSAEDAARRAVAAVTAEPPGHDHADADAHEATPRGLKAASNELVVYRTGAIRGVAGENKLAYVVEVTNKANIRDIVFVDANTDKLLNRYSMIHEGLERHVYEQQYDAAHKVWSEGDPYPGTLNTDQKNIVDGTGEAYWFFKNVFGQDSYDGAGHKMEIVNNDPRISCPNANWNGTTTNYCNGVTSDDVVAHEWGHAYTEYSHNLIYQWQQGALNESYSDIWGETVDLINGRMDEEEGDITAKRTDGMCSSHTAAKPVAVINSPASIAKICEAGAAQFGPVLTGTGVTGDVVAATDADEDGGAPAATTLDGCSAFDNAAAVSGKIAIVSRGSCGFVVKVKNAQNAGAIAVLVADNVEAAPSPMGGADPTIVIPSVRIRLSDGNLIRNALATQTVNVTLKDAGGDREDSYRWLMGEDSSAFGGAIRDMWTPTCVGDPGKVSDAEYYCATDDGGGVHSNSGVPNHAYALTVDGGTYNGHTITGIGLTKAAAIYYRAMTEYQTPTTNFADHADSLAQACTDLVGAELKDLSVAAKASTPSNEVIAAADCATLDEVAAAVELRQEPVQCNFAPLLDPNTPAVCGPGFKQNVVWSEDFEDGLAGWDTDKEVVYPVASGSPWVADSTLPGDRSGSAAYGPAPDQGQCDGTAADFSSRDSIISPLIELPGAGGKAPRLTFDHYVLTEAGFDGGNVKIKVEDAAKWTVIPAAAYVFNAPGTLATEAAGNTNPMAGEPGFSGTDGGVPNGSWGQSQINLAKAGATPGDTIQLRFDIGRDGCGGIDGWYIDDIKVSTCKAKVKVDAVQVPTPSSYGTRSRVDVTVERDGTSGEAPNGMVVLKKADGTIVGTDAVVEGEGSVRLPSRFAVGTTPLTATFSGAGTAFANEADEVSVVVKKATSTTTVAQSTLEVRKGRAFAVNVRTRASGVTPSGVVRIYKGTTLIARGTLSGGLVQIWVPTTKLAVGRHTLVAKYGGSPTVSPSRRSFTITVVR